MRRRLHSVPVSYHNSNFVDPLRSESKPKKEKKSKGDKAPKAEKAPTKAKAEKAPKEKSKSSKGLIMNFLLSSGIRIFY